MVDFICTDKFIHRKEDITYIHKISDCVITVYLGDKAEWKYLYRTSEARDADYELIVKQLLKKEKLVKKAVKKSKKRSKA